MTFLPTVLRPTALRLSVAALALVAVSASAQASPGETQQTGPAPAPAAAQQSTTPAPAPDTTATFSRGRKKKADQPDNGKVVQSKDTRKAAKQTQKTAVAAGPVSARLPDKVLYDKAMDAIKRGRYDVARLDLQTMLNTYPDSQYQMRAKLAVADSWYKEGGTAALTQAESEYADFRVFFPNAPEAAEAQMRIGDIYFKQMDKPDRDYAKALHAEEEYRRMLTDYPDAPKDLLVQAKTRLREVQEVMATREANIAAYYTTRENWAASIARYQTVVDTYPLYSHMDDVLIGLGDSYEAEARYVRNLKVPAGANGKVVEDAKGKLEAEYDGLAAEMYRKVVLDHSAAPHVEDAKDRLVAMNLPIPTPSPAQVAASQALEDSRHQYQMTDYVRLFILHQPDVVTTAGIGEPSLTDPKPINAPTIVNRVQADFKAAFTPVSAAVPVSKPAVAPAGESADNTTTANTTPTDDTSAPAKPLQFNNVGSGDTGGTPSGTVTMIPSSGGGPSTTTTSIGSEILTNAATTPGTAAAAAGKPAPNYGLPSAGPTNAQALPAIEKPAEAPDQINTVSAPTPAAQADPAPGKKAPKPAYDKDDESSSKHKKKKGLQKLNPL